MPPFIAICTRPSPSIPASSERTPGFAVPILPVHRNALFLRIHPIALQGQRRVGEGTGGAGDGGQGSSARGAGNVITWAVLSIVCAEYTRLAALCRPNLTVFLHQPGKRTAVGDKVAHLLRLAVRRFRSANHRLQRCRRLQLMGERGQPVGELQDLGGCCAALRCARR